MVSIGLDGTHVLKLGKVSVGLDGTHVLKLGTDGKQTTAYCEELDLSTHFVCLHLCTCVICTQTGRCMCIFMNVYVEARNRPWKPFSLTPLPYCLSS